MPGVISASVTFPTQASCSPATEVGAEAVERRMKKKEEEIDCLRSIVHKLSSELSKYQVGCGIYNWVRVVYSSKSSDQDQFIAMI